MTDVLTPTAKRRLLMMVGLSMAALGFAFGFTLGMAFRSPQNETISIITVALLGLAFALLVLSFIGHLRRLA